MLSIAMHFDVIKHIFFWQCNSNIYRAKNITNHVNFIILRESVHHRIYLPQNKRCTGSPRLVVTTLSLWQVCSSWAQRTSITIVWLVCGIYLSLQHWENHRVYCVEHLKARLHPNPLHICIRRDTSDLSRWLFIKRKVIYIYDLFCYPKNSIWFWCC